MFAQQSTTAAPDLMERPTSVVLSTSFASASRTTTTPVPKAIVLLDAHSTSSPPDSSPPSLRTKIWGSFSTFVRSLHASATHEPRIVVLAVDAREDGVQPHLTVLADAVSIQDPRALQTAMTRLRGALNARQLPTMAVFQYAHALLREVAVTVDFTFQPKNLKPILYVFTAPAVADALRTAAVAASPVFTVQVCVPSSLPPSVLAVTLLNTLASVLRLDFTLTLPVVESQSSHCVIQMAAQPRFVGNESPTIQPVQLLCVHIVTIESVREDMACGTPFVVWGTDASDALIFRLRATRAALLCVESQSNESTNKSTFVLLPAISQRNPELALLRKMTTNTGVLPLPTNTPHNHLPAQSKDPSAEMADLFVRKSRPVPLNNNILSESAPTELPAQPQPIRRVRFDVGPT